MKRSYLLIAFIILFVSACSFTPEPQAQNVKALIKTEFLGGGLTIAYDEDGEFQSITSVSTSKVTSKLPSAEMLNDNTASKLRNTIALKVRENITQTSSQILKGTFVQSEKHDAYKNQVIVTVVTGVGSVDTSNQLMKLMSQ